MLVKNEQKDTIRSFRKGSTNLLISTSIAEEGLDIPECNLVVRYGLLTNAIAQQQASGRARASGSVYSVIAPAGGRELRRENLNDQLEVLTSMAISKIQQMDPWKYQNKITEVQTEALLARQMKEESKLKKRSRLRAAEVQLVCRSCFVPVASGSDIKLIDNMHYVNVNPNFKIYYKLGGQVFLERTFLDWEPGCVISCASCSKE